MRVCEEPFILEVSQRELNVSWNYIPPRPASHSQAHSDDLAMRIGSLG